MDAPTCFEHDKAFTREHMLANHAHGVHSMIFVSMSSKGRRKLMKRLMVKSNNFMSMHSKQHKDVSEKFLCDAIFYHYYSYDKNNQPVLTIFVPFEDPMREHSAFDF